MAFTFGFYNALNHDRRYNAIQVSSIFDGIIKDGVFMSIGGHMNVKATGNGFNIVVESGRAWFNHTWSLLDADYPMVVPPSDVLEDRIDVVVLEVNENVDVRQNFIKIIAGTPAEHPTKPALTNNLDIHQYALAYITVPANSVTLTQSNVENAIGLGSTPFVTGILETINIDDLVAQWKSQWSDWTEEVDLNWNNWFDTVDNAWTTWFTQQQSKWEDILTDRTEEWEEIKDTVDSEWASQQGSINSDYTNWKSSALAAYNQWLDQIKGTLDDDAATQLAKEVVELKNRDDVISTYQHVKSGTEHIFIGSGSNGKVKMTSDIASGDKVVISTAPKEKVTVEGATSQPGSGDPSPNNIRMIDGVGMYDRMIVLDGSEQLQKINPSDENRWDYQVLNVGRDAVSVMSDYLPGYTNRSYLNTAPGISIPSLDVDFFTINMGPFLSENSAAACKSYLSAHPLIVWYKSVNYAKSTGPFYTVVELSDDPYRAVGFELTQPLFNGDSLKVGGKSGFDQMVVLDGSEQLQKIKPSDENRWDYQVLNVGRDAVSVMSDYLPGYTNRSYLNTAPGISIPSLDVDFFTINMGPFLSENSAAACKSYLSAHPLTVFYKSINYTEDEDIPVALESRKSFYKIFDGTEEFTLAYSGEEANEYDLVLSGAGTILITSSDDNASCSHFKKDNFIVDGNWQASSMYNDVTIQFFRSKTDCPDVGSFKRWLQEEYENGTPVQCVMNRTTAVTYAHLAQSELIPAYYGFEEFVDAIAGEDVTGRWLTFTNDGEQLNFKGGGALSKSKLGLATAALAEVLTGKTFYAGDKVLKVGTMPNQGAWGATYAGEDITIPDGYHNGSGKVLVDGGNKGTWSSSVSAGSSINIPKGWHNGKGKVTADSLGSQTPASAKNGDILLGKTAWVNGVMVTGTMPEKGTWNGTYSGSDVTIPNGHHSGTGKVSVSGGNRGAWNETIDPGASVRIPQGYHNGNGVVRANGISINFHPIDRTVGWGSGVRFTGEDATPGASGKMHFVLKYWCRTEYNVNGYIKVLRNGSEIHSTTFNKNYDRPYNDDVPNGYINVEFSGSGTYQIQVSVDYNAGNGEIKMGGAFIGY